MPTSASPVVDAIARACASASPPAMGAPNLLSRTPVRRCGWVSAPIPGATRRHTLSGEPRRRTTDARRARSARPATSMPAMRSRPRSSTADPAGQSSGASTLAGGGLAEIVREVLDELLEDGEILLAVLGARGRDGRAFEHVLGDEDARFGA